MTTHCPTGATFVQSSAEARAMRKREALHFRVEHGRGGELADLLEAVRSGLEPAEADDYASRLATLETRTLKARLDVESAERGMRGAEERKAHVDVRLRRLEYLRLCRATVRKEEEAVVRLRDELERAAVLAGVSISANWPQEVEA